MTHPVLAALAARAGGGPRDDGRRVALVIEGGGMRGVVSAAMAGAIEDLGLTECFDLAVGTSAGALNAAAMLAGVANGCAREYSDGFAGREFINPARLLLGRPAVDVEFVLDFSSAGLDADRHTRALASPVELHCVATDVATAAPAGLTGMSTPAELRGALLATSRLPWVGGHPVPHGDATFLDGGLTEPVPVPTALRAGATHVLVLLTRPVGAAPPKGGGMADRIVERRLRALNPDLVSAYRRRDAEAQRMLRSLAAAGDSGPPYFLTVSPSPGAPVPSRLERDRAVLRAAAEDARQRTMRTLAPISDTATPDVPRS